jgi:hypothetical protein
MLKTVYRPTKSAEGYERFNSGHVLPVRLFGYSIPSGQRNLGVAMSQREFSDSLVAYDIHHVFL